MSDVQQRAAEVIYETVGGEARQWHAKIAAALAAAGLLVDDDTAKYVALGKELEYQQNQHGPLWYYSAIYRGAQVEE